MIYKRYFVRAIEFKKGLKDEEIEKSHADLVFYVFAPNAIIAQDIALDFLADLSGKNRDMQYRFVFLREVYVGALVNYDYVN